MKKDRRKHDIKSKLVAAICMLLVSSIMMVSSTYAWFTLSTAPEVKGINTAVGANGNLEMALLPESGNLADILDASGNMTTVEKNTTWGNLVDLSEGYGLDNITLYPSMLNIADGATTLTEGALLSVPTYGADGRVSGFTSAALTAIYGGGVFGTAGHGVRAIGTSSGMSPREIAYREAIAAGNSAANKAATAASTALSTGGSSLASIAMKKAQDSASTYTQAEVLALQTAFDSLISETGALTYAEESLKQYVIAYALISLTDNDYAATLPILQTSALADLSTRGTTKMQAAATALAGTKNTVTTASSEIEALLNGSNADTTYTWDQISKYVAYLADLDGMTLNNQSLSYWLTKNEDGSFKYLNELMGQVSNLVLTISETGIYVEIGNLVGSYNASVTMNNLTYGDWNLSGIKANMKVAPAVDTSHLDNSKTDASTYDTGAFGSGDGSTISDYYGYIIDLGFRTNAADSYLQLQTSGIDRIYSDNEGNAATMGGGSTMSFSYANINGYTEAQLKNLMSCIRVVFFDPTTLAIKGHARLDASTAVTADSKVTMDLKMWDITANVENGVAAGTWAESNTIMPLTQNTATALSAMVYLDGQNLTNADVANANITGTMNIQFSSSADLVPMEYGDLRDGNGETTTKYDVKVNGTTVGQVEKDADYTLELSNVTVGDVSLDDYTITEVKMNGTALTLSDVYDSTNNKLTINDVSGVIEITATPKTT